MTTKWDSVPQNKEKYKWNIPHWNSGNRKDLSLRNLKIYTIFTSKHNSSHDTLQTAVVSECYLNVIVRVHLYLEAEKEEILLASHWD